MEELTEFTYLDNDFYKGVKEVLEQARKRVYRNIQNGDGSCLLANWKDDC